jgi:hypothetical protein
VKLKEERNQTIKEDQETIFKDYSQHEETLKQVKGEWTDKIFALNRIKEELGQVDQQANFTVEQ